VHCHRHVDHDGTVGVSDLSRDPLSPGEKQSSSHQTGTGAGHVGSTQDPGLIPPLSPDNAESTSGYFKSPGFEFLPQSREHQIQTFTCSARDDSPIEIEEICNSRKHLSEATPGFSNGVDGDSITVTGRLTHPATGYSGGCKSGKGALFPGCERFSN
jgi:hypothetical protein